MDGIQTGGVPFHQPRREKVMKLGDWVCLHCNDVQFRRNTKCRRCSAPAPAELLALSAGDWNCPGCGDLQFARNTNCRKCGQANPKPHDPVAGLKALHAARAEGLIPDPNSSFSGHPLGAGPGTASFDRHPLSAQPSSGPPKKKTRWDPEPQAAPPPTQVPTATLSPGLTLRNGVAVWAEPLRQTRDITIPASQKGAIVGKQGEYMNYLRKETGATVKVTYNDGEETALIVINGKTDQVDKCEQMIQAKLSELAAPSTIWDMKLIDIPKEYVKHTIGPGGAHMHQMSAMSECRVKFVRATELDENAPPEKQIACIRGPADKMLIAEQLLFDKVMEVSQAVAGHDDEVEKQKMAEAQAQQQMLAALAGAMPQMTMPIDVSEWPELDGVPQNAAHAGQQGIAEAIAQAAAVLGISPQGLMQQGEAVVEKRKGPACVPCKFQMRQPGSCKHGDACTFSHDPYLLAAAAGAADGIGADITEVNPDYKKTFCRYFESGRCTRGATCVFAHGIEELRGGMNPRNIEIMQEAQARAAADAQARLEREAAKGDAPAAFQGQVTDDNVGWG